MELANSLFLEKYKIGKLVMLPSIAPLEFLPSLLLINFAAGNIAISLLAFIKVILIPAKDPPLPSDKIFVSSRIIARLKTSCNFGNFRLFLLILA